MLYYLTTIIFMAVLLPKSFYDFGITRNVYVHISEKRGLPLGSSTYYVIGQGCGGFSEIVTLLNKLI